jgi:hypothetical protein
VLRQVRSSVPDVYSEPCNLPQGQTHHPVRAHYRGVHRSW